MTSDSVQAISAMAEISAVSGLLRQRVTCLWLTTPQRRARRAARHPVQFLCQTGISGCHGLSLEIRFATVVSQEGTKHNRQLCFNLPVYPKDKNTTGNIVSYSTSPKLSAPPLRVQPDFLPISLGQLSRAHYCRSWTPLSGADVTGASGMSWPRHSVSQQVCRASQGLSLCLPHYGPFCCAVLRMLWGLPAKISAYFQQEDTKSFKHYAVQHQVLCSWSIAYHLLVFHLSCVYMQTKQKFCLNRIYQSLRAKHHLLLANDSLLA